jgi:hypothetical protein
MTPLGVMITPPPSVQISKELQAALPKHRSVRLIQRTTMTDGGEEVVIY